MGPARLAGATFVLRDDQGAEIARRITQDNGEVVFGDLDPGTYAVEELSPPPGCQAADPASVQVTVAITETPNGSAVDVTPALVVFANRRAVDDHEPVDGGDPVGDPDDLPRRPRRCDKSK